MLHDIALFNKKLNNYYILVCFIVNCINNNINNKMAIDKNEFLEVIKTISKKLDKIEKNIKALGIDSSSFSKLVTNECMFPRQINNADKLDDVVTNVKKNHEGIKSLIPTFVNLPAECTKDINDAIQLFDDFLIKCHDDDIIKLYNEEDEDEDSPLYYVDPIDDEEYKMFHEKKKAVPEKIVLSEDVLSFIAKVTELTKRFCELSSQIIEFVNDNIEFRNIDTSMTHVMTTELKEYASKYFPITKLFEELHQVHLDVLYQMLQDSNISITPECYMILICDEMESFFKTADESLDNLMRSRDVHYVPNAYITFQNDHHLNFNDMEQIKQDVISLATEYPTLFPH